MAKYIDFLAFLSCFLLFIKFPDFSWYGSVITDKRNQQTLSCLPTANHLHDVQAMNIVPQAWVVKLLSQHYAALQGGGDMWLMNNFNTYGVRQGFMLDDEPHYHSEILSLHGFHFELKAVRQNKQGAYTLYMQVGCNMNFEGLKQYHLGF